VISFEAIIVPLSATLGLSIAVERILEFLNNIFERSIGVKWVRKIPRLSELDTKIKTLEETYKNGQSTQDSELKEEVPINIVLVKPATDPDDGKMLKTLILELVGVAAGIILARVFNVKLFNIFLPLVKASSIPAWADFTLTGILIGGGSGPIHILIRFISERKITPETDEHLINEREMPADKTKKIVAPAIIAQPSLSQTDGWIDIPYNGGVDCDKLEDVHKRKKDPNLIVYHHTAMSCNSTFGDVIRVIKDRNWSTGYNCVILADGTICPFCRWDRYGNHAKGYNLRSLGVAFNGNYETDPKIPYSNPNGKYGLPRPTEEQLKAGARVVSLWATLYDDIEIDFDKKIIPHNDISNKTCPGTMFPYDEFKKWIEYYWNSWNKSSAIKEKITAFDLKPYIHV